MDDNLSIHMISVYRKRAKRYDWTTLLLYLIGFMKKAAPVLAKLMTGPFGGTVEMGARKPWQSLKTYLALVQFRDLFHWGAYIAVGEKG